VSGLVLSNLISAKTQAIGKSLSDVAIAIEVIGTKLNIN
jgi:hypothetical protein